MTGGLAARRDISGMSSFGVMGNELEYTPPAASKHPLFSHHAHRSPSVFSEDGPPSPSSVSSGAFSPASAFLSHFSSSTSLKGASSPDAQGAKVLEYTLDKLIGRGGFSAVRKAIHPTGEVFACKIVKRDDLSDTSGSLEKFEEEIRIWKTLPRHPSLLPLLEMHRTPFATFLITPYLPGGSLLDVLKREHGSEKTARKWFPGVVTAVATLHEGFEGWEGQLLHGDLKLDNFLVDHHGKVMVGDFGMAQKINEPMSITIPPPVAHTLPTHSRRSHVKSRSQIDKGLHPIPVTSFPSASMPYAPPELLQAPPSVPSLAQDIWALGIILHALLTGRLPFTDAFDPRLQMKILRGEWEEPPFLGREWLACLRGCLDGNRQTRWTIRQVRECDAVIGWTEVKARSRSRSRMRNPRLVESGKNASSPVAINTPRRGQSREPDPFSLRPRSASTSGTNSRSRSSGAGHIFDLSDMGSVEEERGRSTATKPQSLTFTRAQRSTSGQRPPTTAPNFDPRSRSKQRIERSKSRQREDQTSTSPSASRSRHAWDQELDVVDEEGRVGRPGWTERFGEMSAGRSRSRGRPSAPSAPSAVRR
jgi:serine/threonine protein kinase